MTIQTKRNQCNREQMKESDDKSLKILNIPKNNRVNNINKHL